MENSELGYGVEAGYLSEGECEDVELSLRVDTGCRTRAGSRHLMANPAISALANSKGMKDLARLWLGTEAVPFRATLFDKSGAANWLIPWHQDTALPLTERFDLADWGPWSEKSGVIYAHAPASALARVIALRVHLDDSESDNGPLRVIPGSHLRGVLSDQSVAEIVAANAPVECCVLRGGVIAMRPLIIHASSKVRSSKPRRVIHIEYADSLDLAPGIRLAVA